MFKGEFTLNLIPSVASGKRQTMVKDDLKTESVASSAFMPIKSQNPAVNPILQNLLHRQKRGRKHELTDQQKQLQLIAKVTDPGYTRAENARRKALNEKRCQQALKDVKELIAEMDAAHDQDHKVLT